MWEPTGLSTLEETVGREPLEHLDRAGLIAVRTEGRRQQVTLAHPLYGEILRGRMPALTRRRLLLALADRIDAYGARRREDAVRVATARLEATGWAEPALLVRAARLARYGQDFVQVERLGQAALLGGMTPEAGLLVGEALHELGRFDEAEQVLADASAQDTPDGALRVQLTEIRSRNLMWGLLRFDDALAVNRASRTQVDDPADVEELDLNEALLLVYSGRPLDALGALAPITSPTRPRARALRALAEVPALVATGRCEQGAEEAGRAFAEHSALPEQIAIPGPGVHLVTQVYALAECGRLAEAERAGHGGLRGHAGQRAARRADLVRAPARSMRAPLGASGHRAAVVGRGARPVRGLRAGERPSPGAVRAGDRARLAGRRRGRGRGRRRARSPPAAPVRGVRARDGASLGVGGGR